ASRDFLDIFNHRLISLLYRARQQQRIGLEVQQPWESQFAQHLFALLGFGTPGLQQRMQLDEHVLLFYTGLFAQESRSLSTLEKMLSHFFQVIITAEPFIGQWLNIAEDDYTRIGVSGQNQRLGQTVALGTRVWDLHSQFALHIGPLNFKTFIDFLPIGLGFMPLCEMTRLFVGPELDFEINLSLKAAEIPETRLSSTGQARLGWTSGLKTQPCEHDNHLKLSSKLFYDRQKKSAIPIFASLQPYELERVLNQMTSNTYPMHTKVLKQGEVGDSLLIIRHGEVQVRYQGLDGQQHLLAILGEGQFFGEMSFLTRSSRTVTVITITACQILELSQPHLAQIIEQYPQVKKTLEVYYQQRVVQWRMR
ncbi:MAG TPA: type VI secretion system baseplate subunit TssG, partial [Gammaproteobacteria bacterium]|nr:type VI secretion system baseplate subunit TssG [Gammaproteobacteria bacterium]